MQTNKINLFGIMKFVFFTHLQFLGVAFSNEESILALIANVAKRE